MGVWGCGDVGMLECALLLFWRDGMVSGHWDGECSCKNPLYIVVPQLPTAFRQNYIESGLVILITTYKLQAWMLINS
ncbi:hypothetical protein M011DRAFT_470127, partial [Sporormia fimetaria CBS 119925]